MSTERTVEEARDFIDKSISAWNIDEEDNKIISLANIVEKLRFPTISPTMRKNVFEKNINSLKDIMRRNLTLDPEYDNSAVQSLLDSVKSNLDELLKTYVAPIPRKRTRKQRKRTRKQ